MKKSIQSTILIVFIASLLMDAHAQIRYIWRIGKSNVIDFSPQEEKVIGYDVPLDWEEMLGEEDPNWGEFPLDLYSEAAGDDKPQEVSVNFDYPEDLNNPTLCIKAILDSPASQGTYHNLVICKGEDVIIGEPLMDEYPSITYVALQVGYLKKGTHEENRIIIKVDSSSDIPVVFYSLWMRVDDEDSDGDGVSDEDEGDEEVSNDSATAALPIRSYDPNGIERITLHIEGEEGSTVRFREVRFIDANSSNLPGGLLSAHYFPYGFLDFRIEEVDPLGEVVLLLRYPERIYPSARFYASQYTGEWQEIPFEIVNDYSVNIPLSDGGEGDYDGQKDGFINTQLTLAYPQGFGVHIDKTGCFISEISGGNKR
jgi:hypothetical protein